MKLLTFISVLMLTACASHAPRKRIVVSAVEPMGHPVNGTMLRTPEQLKEYRFGRYVDPGDPLVMHDIHPVYRIESSAGWNLTPGNTAMSPLHLATAASTGATRDAIIAEINKQRAATRAFADEVTKLNQRLSTMSQTAASMSDLAQQNLTLKSEIGTVEHRLDAMDNQILAIKPIAPNSIPAPDKW